MEVRITTGSRLHFGLLDVAAPFGGCGVMVDRPATIVCVRNADRFTCSEPHRARIESIVDRFSSKFSLDHRPAVAIEVLQSAPSHTGLGSGTQLSLAIAEAIIRSNPSLAPEPSEGLIFEIAGRGHRSAVGCHGYFLGGLIVEGLHPNSFESINPLSYRLNLPDSWRTVMWLPNENVQSVDSVSGLNEQKRFEALPKVSPTVRQSLVDCLTERLIPAVQRADFSAFADAVTHYNRGSGELFAAVQDGPYNGEAASLGIQTLRELDVQGVGQSSWGPGLFGWFDSPASASRAMDLNVPNYQVGWIAQPLNASAIRTVSSTS